MINQLNACYFYSITLWIFVVFPVVVGAEKRGEVASGVKVKKANCESGLSMKLTHGMTGSSTGVIVALWK